MYLSMPHLPVLGARWGKGGDLPHFLLQGPHPWGHNSMSNPYRPLPTWGKVFFYYWNLTTKHSNTKRIKKTNSDDKYVLLMSHLCTLLHWPNTCHSDLNLRILSVELFDFVFQQLLLLPFCGSVALLTNDTTTSSLLHKAVKPDVQWLLAVAEIGLHLLDWYKNFKITANGGYLNTNAHAQHQGGRDCVCTCKFYYSDVIML